MARHYFIEFLKRKPSAVQLVQKWIEIQNRKMFINSRSLHDFLHSSPPTGRLGKNVALIRVVTLVIQYNILIITSALYYIFKNIFKHFKVNQKSEKTRTTSLLKPFHKISIEKSVQNNSVTSHKKSRDCLKDVVSDFKNSTLHSNLKQDFGMSSNNRYSYYEEINNQTSAENHDRTSCDFRQRPRSEIFSGQTLSNDMPRASHRSWHDI